MVLKVRHGDEMALRYRRLLDCSRKKGAVLLFLAFLVEYSSFMA